MLCYVMLCYVMLCYVMVWYGMLCYVYQIIKEKGRHSVLPSNLCRTKPEFISGCYTKKIEVVF